MAQAVSTVTAPAWQEGELVSCSGERLPQSHSPSYPRGLPGSFSDSVSPALPKAALKMSSPLLGEHSEGEHRRVCAGLFLQPEH